MRSRRACSAVAIAGWVCGALMLGAGCNSILGNEKGTLFLVGIDGSVSEAGGTDASGTSDVPAPPPVDGGGFDAALSCPPGKKLCATFQACVNPDDPNFGCGDSDCLACKTENASAVTCVGGDAGIICKSTCNAGFEDCDTNGSCETDLSKSTSCGACGNACSQLAPLCSRNDQGQYHCVGSCPAGQTQCGTDCVDLKTNPDHCGSCPNACPPVSNGRATCQNGQCGGQCNLQFHQCGNVCAADSDATKCGASCTNCLNGPSPPNAAPATCQGNQCTWTSCLPGWDDCDLDLMKGADGNGCETSVLSDSNNCGKCGTVCPGGVIYLGRASFGGPVSDMYCCNGACVPQGTLCAETL